MRRSAALLLAALAGLGGSAHSQETHDSDLDALLLADQAPAVTETAQDWKVYLEGAMGPAWRRDGDNRRYDHRLSLDIHYDRSFSSEWRAVLANRLDFSWPARGVADNAINTLKEAYLSWRLQPDALMDLGRVNVRNGVATGYNPTDFFRAGALRTIVSINPASLKENRLGSAMVRGQKLWDSGSLTAIYSPKLESRASRDGLDPDWGATNHRHRGLLALSQKITDGLAPQFLIYQEDGRSPRFGANVTGLINNATVGYLEWSGGRSPSLLTQALDGVAPTCGCESFRNQVSTGLTYTAPNKLSLTAEYQYNGAGLEKNDWDALRQGHPARYGRYRAWAQTQQELPTRQALFFYAGWEDALIHHLDLSAMHQVDLADNSRRSWLEARYHGDRVDYALQWQHSSGQRTSHFGAMPEARGWQAVVRHYF